MLWHRRILFALTLLGVTGSLALTGGYAYYIHSPAYRAEVARGVGEFLTLPTRIDGVEARTRSSRGFHGVRLYLPGGDTQIFESKRAVWQEAAADSGKVNELDVYDGWLQLGSPQVGEGGYTEVLRGGLAHDFTALNLANVRFHNIDLRWRQPKLHLEAQDADGLVTFQRDGTGQAQLETYTLNGTKVDEPITIRAAFRSGAELEFRNILLNVPRMPLGSLALEEMTGAPISQGWYEGTVSFRPDATQQVYTLRGAIEAARLEDFTRALPTGAVHGRLDVDLTEARVAPGQVLALAFGGRLEDIQVADLGRVLGVADLRGGAALTVARCAYAGGSLKLLSAKGDVQGVPAEAVTRLIGRGKITGVVRVKVNALLIEDDDLRHADVEIDVTPPEGAPGIIERAVVLAIAKEALGVDLGRVGDYLPESVEYTRMGCRLIADGDELRVKGSHGEAGETVLTLKVFGRELGVLDAPDRTFPIGGLIDEVRNRIAGYDRQELLRRLQGRTLEGELRGQ